MKNPRRQKVYRGILIVVIAVILVGAGCASREKVESLPAAVSHNLIKKIVTEDSDVGKKIIIEGEAPLAYAFFRLSPQPLKLVLDIPQAELASEVTTTISVDDEVIKEIIALQHDDDVEVSIHLHKLVRYKVQKEGNLLSIDVGRQSPLLVKEEEQEAEEIAIVKEIPPPVQEEVITKELAPAKSLVDVFLDTSQKDRVILTLKADGKLGDYNSFDLQKPTRLVIDLWKVTRKFREKAVSVNSPYLKRVRLGDHPTKVRVVLDIPATVLPSHRIDRIGDGDELMIVLGREVKEEDLLIPPKEEMAQEPVEDVAKEEKKITPPAIPAIPGEITGIDFKQLGDKSRIIISTSVKAPYEVVETGLEHTVLIEIQGMMVPPRLSRPLDTHEFASPVFMITPVNVTVDTQKNTQIFVKLRKMVAFDTQQEDSKIYLDFERTAEFAVAKPKPEEVVIVKEPPTEEAMEEPVVAAKEEIPMKKEKEVAPPVTQAEPVLPSEEEVGKVYTGKKITLDFKEADIHNILRLFAEVSDLNIITTDDVKGKVTVRLVDVPWDQALDILLQANNLGVERIGNVIRIAPLARLSAEKKARAEAVKATEELEPLVSEMIPINYGDANEIGTKGVKPLLSGRGSVVVDERTNTLVITDIRSNVEKAKALVRTLDAQTPQVLIQAKIIEANLDFGRQLGIQWGGRVCDEGAGISGTVGPT
jgi:type IV pilus assembly protein PilQ